MLRALWHAEAMRSLSGFFGILLIFFFYTANKAMELWPEQRALAVAGALVFFCLMVGWQFLYRADPGLLDLFWFRALAWTGGIAMGFWATFVLFSLPFDLIRLFASLLGKVSEAAALDPARRDFLSRGISLSLLGLAGGTSAIGLVQALRRPSVKKTAIPLPGLPAVLYKLKIAQISDLHVGPTISAADVQGVVEATNALEPDLIFLTGDFADGRGEALAAHLAPLAGLRARLGKYYVTGNHEYYWGAEELMERMRSYGIRVLVNEGQILDVEGAKVFVGGVPDIQAHKFLESHRADAARVAKGGDGAQLKILLAHRPEVCLEAEPLGFHLQFSGHTHAGQFFPFSLLMPLAHRYYAGLNRHGRLWLYVNQGTGYWGPPNRFARPQEISLITLQAGENPV
jgi:uncharacterized protein